MSVTAPNGFRAAGITAGLKASGLPDFGLLVGAPETVVAGSFTQNRAAAAPVELTKERLPTGRAVVVNSGQANAATGPRGQRDALESTTAVAEALGFSPAEVLQCSTGVIGEPLPLEAMLAALPQLIDSLSETGGDDFARSIMTTDTVPKQASATGGPYSVGGCAKGVGMIAPNLATMLVFVTTDAAVGRSALQRLVDEELTPRFNSLDVDACPSTNDTVLLFASGAVGEARLQTGDPALEDLRGAVAEVGESLLQQLAADAEGVTHVLLVDVAGAASDGDAQAVAKAVVESPLVKTAAFGGDPNPGRIVQAVGSAPVAVSSGDLDVFIGGVALVRGGVIPPTYFATDDPSAGAARAAMQEPSIRIDLKVGDGPGHGRAVGSDLSHEYVRINGEYTT